MGYAILGLSQAFVFIPAIPDALDAVYLARNIREGEDEYVDGIMFVDVDASFTIQNSMPLQFDFTL